MVPGTDLDEFTLDAQNPLTWCDGEGREWQPDRHFYTDRGSFWDIVSVLIGCSKNQLAFLFHDSGYTPVKGFGRGLYCRVAGFKGFSFRPLSKAQLDDMCRRMLISEGVKRVSARIVSTALRCAFWKRW